MMYVTIVFLGMSRNQKNSFIGIHISGNFANFHQGFRGIIREFIFKVWLEILSRYCNDFELLDLGVSEAERRHQCSLMHEPSYS